MRIKKETKNRFFYVTIFLCVFAAGLGLAHKKLGAFPVIGQNRAHTSSIGWEVKTSHPYVLMNSGGELGVSITAKGTESTMAHKRPPLDLVLVIDRSGSMSERGKLGYAKRAAKKLIRSLGSEDRLGIVAYSTNVQVLFPLQIIEDKASAIKAVEALYPTASTNLSGGLEMGLALFNGALKRSSVKRVILLSDGLANTGMRKGPGLYHIAGRGAEAGIGVTTIGLGLDFDEDLLLNLSQHGAGNYYFVESPRQVASIFYKEFGELVATTARNPVLELDLADGVELVGLFGYEYEQSGRKIRIKTGDFYSGQVRNFTLKFKVPTGHEGENDLFTAVMTYEDALRGMKEARLTQRVDYKIVNDQKLVERSKNLKVIAKEDLASAAKDSYSAAYKYGQGKYKEAVAEMRDAVSTLSRLNSTDEADKKTIEEQKRMERVLDQMEADAPMPSSVEGKRMLKSMKARSYELQK